MTTVVLALIAAVVVEALVEYGKSIAAAVTSKDTKTAITQLCSIAISVGVCFAFGADIFSALGIGINVPWLGTLLTGIFASRGSNYISDIVSHIQSVKTGDLPY